MEEKLAIASVSNKDGLERFISGLVERGYTIISTGGTKKALDEARLPVLAVEDYTGFSEMMRGRVKTLHPKIHGGILCDRDVEADMEDAVREAINMIDIVVVNLYPFRETAAKPGVAPEEVVENIDIGGPSLLRGAAKNFLHVLPICNPGRYDAVLAELAQPDGVGIQMREQLAYETFRHTGEYDIAIADWMQRQFALTA